MAFWALYGEIVHWCHGPKFVGSKSNPGYQIALALACRAVMPFGLLGICRRAFAVCCNYFSFLFRLLIIITHIELSTPQQPIHPKHFEQGNGVRLRSSRMGVIRGAIEPETRPKEQYRSHTRTSMAHRYRL